MPDRGQQRIQELRKLSYTIARLQAMRASQAGAPDGLDTGRLLPLAGFGPNPGGLRALTYAPERLAAGAPLVVVLHGCTQTAAVYDRASGWSELADREGFALLYPQQERANNANLCFNWFQPADASRDGGEAQSIRHMVEAAARTHGTDRRRVFVTGLSAGGAMAAAMLATHPDVFAGGAIIAGLPYGVASTVPEAFDRMRGHGGPSGPELSRLVGSASGHRGPWPKVSVWHGSADATVVPANAQALVEQWRAVHGLEAQPTLSSRDDGQEHRVWLDDAGEEVLEEYRIAGMGHGTPLATRGPDGLGQAAPFMIEAGISSTRRIAEFFGIAPRRRAPSVPDLTPSDRPAAPRPEPASQERPRVDPAAFPGAGTSAGVRRIIEDALRSAGLMK
jgi:poly(hydroxyalkanoate) depolymerase family esterase